MSIASKKHVFDSLGITRYSTIIKYTESEKSLHGVLQELWYNIPSSTITSLRADNRLPSTDPDVVNILPHFGSPSNFHTKYGQRLIGYLQVNSSNIIFSCKWSHIMLINKNLGVVQKEVLTFDQESSLTLGRTRKFIPPPWHKGGGGEGGWNPSPECLIYCSILKRFCLQWKAFDLLNKLRYILWVVAPLEFCDVTNNGRHLGFD